MDADRAELFSFVHALPKTETHLHMEGALPYELLRELDPSRFPDNPEFRQPGYKFDDFVSFETLLIDHAIAWFTSAERYYIAAKKIFEDLVSQNIKYVETSVHLAISEFIGVDGRDIVQAVKSAAPEGLEVKVIGAFTRDGCTEAMKPVVESLHAWEGLDGIDMHGQEWLELEDWAAPAWRRCRDAGKILKAHAGEFGGPEKIVEALDQLGAKRIQHGVRSVEDPDLVSRLVDEGIVLDTCPISNEKLRVFESMETHSLRQLFDAGAICTINTDDPLLFANTIEDEYIALADRLSFSRAELAQLARNGFETSQMDASLKNRYLQEIDALEA